MPLQNRVAPDGSLHAVVERGTMLGNRGGKFHRNDQTLCKRRHASFHWICCELHYKDMHHEAMGQGYTSLFFLDEVTALAAGHRPCFFCRRKEARAFLGSERVTDFDAALHRERLASRPVVVVGDLPDGTMIAMDGRFFAVRHKRLLRWSFAGYTDAQNVAAALQAKLLTPARIAAILAHGYQPRWHPSALNGDN